MILDRFPESLLMFITFIVTKKNCGQFMVLYWTTEKIGCKIPI